MSNSGIWADDKLGRQGDADFLERLLRGNADDLRARGVKKSYVLNIDAGWGRGKTFFLTRFQRQLEASGHLVAYVNAWEDDFAEDPLTAVMAAIDEVVSANVEKASAAATTWQVAKEAAGRVAVQAGKGLLIRGLGLLMTEGAAAAAVGAIGAANAAASGAAIADEATKALDKLVDEKMANSVGDFVASKKIVADFKARLGDFVARVEDSGKARPFFILVDELDRCRPPYAIAMLERIKHLFDIPQVAFVVATDLSQLGEAIKGVYGGGFDSPRYLRRFFDSTFVFEKPKVGLLIEHLIQTQPLTADVLSAPQAADPIKYLGEFCYHTDLDVRAIEHVFGLLHSIALSWPYKVKIELAVIMPLILAHYEGHRDDIPADEMKNFFVPKIKVPWTLEKRERRRDSFAMVTRTIDQGAVTADMWRIASGFLPEIVASDGIEQWIAARFSEEYGLLHGNAWRTDQPKPRSIILKYPSIVRQAGRLQT